MRGQWSLAVACNDHRDGSFAGRAECFNVLDPYGDAVANFTVDQFPVRFADEPGRIRLGARFDFAVTRKAVWWGNWCWNRYWLGDEDAARAVRLLMKAASLDGGQCEFVERLERGDLVTADMLRAYAEAAP